MLLRWQKTKYTPDQAIEIAEIGVELGQERAHIKRFVMHQRMLKT